MTAVRLTAASKIVFVNRYPDQRRTRVDVDHNDFARSGDVQAS